MAVGSGQDRQDRQGVEATVEHDQVAGLVKVFRS